MWPQVALTHHAKLSRCIETHPDNPVNPGILLKDLLRPEFREIQREAWQQRISGNRLGII